MLMLQGNEYFAWQHIVKNSSKGTVIEKAPYRPCYELAQLQKYEEEIFNGKKTAGFYSIKPNNLTRWAALDFDDHGGVGMHWQSIAEAAYKLACSRFDECWFLQTHPGGFHIAGFVSDFIPAKEMRATLKGIAPEDVEIFPKQDFLSDKKNAKGNPLRFPGRHLLKGHWAQFIDRSGRIEIPTQKVEQANSKKWENPSFQGELKSLYVAATKGLVITGEGQRYNAMQSLAGRLKGRADRDKALQIYAAWHRRYASMIRTPFEQSVKQFMTWFDAAKPCNIEIPPYTPNEEEEKRILNLPKLKNIKPDLLKEVARLFLRVKNHAQSKGVQVPWLSCRTISEELNMSIPTASRYREACVRLGLVQLVETGHTGVASTYLIK